MSADDGQYRTCLSTNMVTGKLDMREVASSLPDVGVDSPDKANNEGGAP